MFDYDSIEQLGYDAQKIREKLFWLQELVGKCKGEKKTLRETANEIRESEYMDGSVMEVIIVNFLILMRIEFKRACKNNEITEEHVVKTMKELRKEYSEKEKNNE